MMHAEGGSSDVVRPDDAKSMIQDGIDTLADHVVLNEVCPVVGGHKAVVTDTQRNVKAVISFSYEILNSADTPVITTHIVTQLMNSYEEKLTCSTSS